jgi:3-deoxy-D-manno-octulosonic-acid transferase
MPLLITWLLNSIYALLLLTVSPVLFYRRLAFGKYRGGWREKLTGSLERRHPERNCVWFHAVSVGEVLQLQKVLDEIAARFPGAELLITTTTDTGFEVAKNRYPQHTVAYFPLDFSWAVRRALDAVQPSLVVLVELELWPNFISAVRRRRIPLALINGRIGEKSFRGYLRVRPLLRRVLSCFDALAVQNDVYAERLRTLGAPDERLFVTGNIKFDRVESNRDNSKTQELRCVFDLRPEERVLIAGSTQEPEESYALDTWMALRAEFPDLRLVLVPRHKERFDEVAELIRRRGLPLRRRSETLPPFVAAMTAIASSERPILLLDTLGELAACWGLADIAFVGGSLTNRGGQNMLEPAGYGAAVLFGPNTWNFRDVTEALLSLDAARVVTGPEELTATVRFLLRNPHEAARLGQASRDFVSSQCGATGRTIVLLQHLLTGYVRPAEELRAA